MDKDNTTEQMDDHDIEAPVKMMMARIEAIKKIQIRIDAAEKLHLDGRVEEAYSVIRDALRISMEDAAMVNKFLEEFFLNEAKKYEESANRTYDRILSQDDTETVQ
jgi:hypothetical protein